MYAKDKVQLAKPISSRNEDRECEAGPTLEGRKMMLRIYNTVSVTSTQRMICIVRLLTWKTVRNINGISNFMSI